jgi:hypothetical protein
MNKYSVLVSIGGILIATLILCGCSVTGWSSKEIPDGSNLGRGEQVTIVQKDGNTIMGEYQGIQEIAYSEYLERYKEETAQNINGYPLPQIGEQIKVSTSLIEDKYWDGQLIGFDQKSLWVKLNGKSHPDEFDISSLTTLSNLNGKTLRRIQFRNLFVGGNIPLRTAVVVTKGTKDIIPINTINSITTGIRGEQVVSFGSQLANP